MQSRRKFLAATLAAAAGSPFILPSHVQGAEVAPNSRLGIGFIGMGKQSQGLLGGFLGRKETQVLAVCDVDTTRRTAAQQRVNKEYSENKEYKGCQAIVDYRELLARKDIDAVVIATPDHWHAIITIAALEAGKDVYCEKPLTHNIHEAVEVMKAVEKNKRILQTGSMQRSMKEFRVACELVRNGAIGKLLNITCLFGAPGKPCDLAEESMEPGLDWDRWLGPAPVRPYHSELSPRGIHTHFPHWRNYNEYGGGMVTDWGAHHLDIAHWAMDMDKSGPVEIIPPDSKEAQEGGKLVYANGLIITHKGGNGVEFYGDGGFVKVNRGKIEVEIGGQSAARFTSKEDKTSLDAQTMKLEKGPLADAKVHLYKSQNHMDDFLACIKSREKPVTSEVVGAHTVIACHLLNLGYNHHARIKWDPAKYAFADGTGDAKWLTREYRGEWKV